MISACSFNVRFDTLLTLNRIKSSLLILGIKILDLLAHDQGKLNLIMEVDTLRLDDGTGTRVQDGRGGLQKEEWLLRPLVVELGDMVTEYNF